ncbi:MAG: hypothetical protein K9N62_13235 [Verrucomicrobia bacterium]|nr:hypothetical protein [Verrucomicrobiota bacterium]
MPRRLGGGNDGFCATSDLSDAGGQERRNRRLMWAARIRSSDFVQRYFQVYGNSPTKHEREQRPEICQLAARLVVETQLYEIARSHAELNHATGCYRRHRRRKTIAVGTTHKMRANASL